MSPRKKEGISTTRRQRVRVGVVGLIFMLPGFAALAAGSFFYKDHRNLLVFAPFSLLLGLAMIVFAIRIGNK
jgi:hypothetical protein